MARGWEACETPMLGATWHLQPGEGAVEKETTDRVSVFLEITETMFW